MLGQDVLGHVQGRRARLGWRGVCGRGWVQAGVRGQGGGPGGDFGFMGPPVDYGGFGQGNPYDMGHQGDPYGHFASASDMYRQQDYAQGPGFY